MKIYSKSSYIFSFIALLIGIYSNYEPDKISFIEYTKSARFPAAAAGLDVIIAAGDVVSLTSSTNINHLVINGELHCDEANADSEIVLQATSIVVNGLFKCGDHSNPYDKKFIISLKNSSLDPKQDHRYRGLIVMGGGELELYGTRKNSRWYRLNANLQAGSNELYVDASHLVRNSETQTIQTNFREPQSLRVQKRTPSLIGNLNWSVGDKIVVAPTGYNYLESETFTIQAIQKSSPYKITLDRPATYNHYGQRQIMQSNAIGTFNLDERAEVANLTRSIVIKGDESTGPIDEGSGQTAQRGGHVMVHHNSSAKIDAVEFYKMGQAGVMSRYPFHWHYVHDGTGQFIKNSSIHHSYQRCITVHKTNNVDVVNNVCHNFKGHGFFLEDGDEINNRIIRNLAITAKAPHDSKVLLQSDRLIGSEAQGRFPSVSGYWISNPNNIVMRNNLAGSVGTGFWMSFEKEVKDHQGNIIATPISTDTDIFQNNLAHAAQVGITWDGAPGWQNAGNPNNPNDKKLASAHYRPQTVPVFKNLKAYKNLMTGIYFRGQTAVFENAIMADNGWGAWVAYNNVFQNCVFIGRTQNSSPAMDDQYYNLVPRDSRYRRNGITLYDGPFEVHDSDFLNFSSSEETRVINGRSEITTYVPFTSTGGTNKYVNFTSGLSFDPEPINRMHMHSKAERWRETPMLGNSNIRDMDGSLTGVVGALVVGERSLGKNNTCIDGGETLKNHLVCPATYTEGSFNYMRWGGPVSPWSTPFVVVRADNETNYPIQEWNSISSLPNNAFATANSIGQMYKLLPRFQYDYDNSIGTTARLEANTESENPITPIIQIVAYGYNCHLDGDAIEVNSISDLYQATNTSYYSNGERFYVRLIPVDPWRMYSPTPYIQSTALATNFRYSITCDERPIEKVVKGAITSVTKTRDNTIINGWACNYTASGSIQTKLYVGDSPSSRGFYFIEQKYANQNPNVRTGINCGSVRSQGRHFKFTIPNSVIEQYGKKKIFVQGLSNSGGQHRYLRGSGSWDVYGRKVSRLKQNFRQ